MEYVIDGVEGVFEGRLVENLGGGKYSVMINDQTQEMRIISSGPRGVEFILGQSYHHVRYIERTTTKTSMIIDGTPMEVRSHANLDEIVYKNSGGASASGSEAALLSQIPGKVVSLAVSEGDEVGRGDPVVVLESMKMQVAVKSHADGRIKSLKVKQGDSVAKGDVIAELEA